MEEKVKAAAHAGLNGIKVFYEDIKTLVYEIGESEDLKSLYNNIYCQ
jgi:hypothetical protein